MPPFESADHQALMREALKEAEQALRRGDRPIGAVVVHNGRIIARASNSFATDRSHLAHAELKALLACAPYLLEHGRECAVYTTCEPCVMCLGAIVMANVRTVVFGMPDSHIRPAQMVERVEYVRRRIDHYAGGVLAGECVELYRRYSEAEAGLMLGEPSTADSRSG